MSRSSLAYSFNSQYKSKGSGATSTALNVDLFGLGPAEVVVIAGAAALLYGPGRLKSQLRDSGGKGKIVSEGWEKERLDRITNMRDAADSVRKKRAWNRINTALEIGDDHTMDRFDEYEAFIAARNEEREN